ncbi:MAG: helix-turn-helix domain-containing protein [Desulfovibrio sp.]|jgi:predicted DNA-binding transcriptional regulator AlpA|nr:helix-turn-helix domain-containing protein [Desulfovibrio sp.]
MSAIQQKFFRAKEAAQMLGIAKSTFWAWHKQGKLPPGTKLSRRCHVWAGEDLQEFVRRQSESGGQS